MRPQLPEGYFSLMGREKHNLEGFSKVIASWSLDNLKRSYSSANDDCDLSSILQTRKYSPTPLCASLISYHSAVYIVMVIEFSGFPVEYFEELKRSIVTEICKIKQDHDVLMFSPKDGELIGHLVHKYATSIAENLDRNPRSLTLGTGGEVLESIKQLYDLEDSCLGLETRYKFPMLLNTSISAIYESLIKEGMCKWEATPENND